MKTIATKPRKISLKSAIAFSFVMCAWMTAPACSSSSETSEFPNDSDGGDGATLPTCTAPIEIGNANYQTNTYSGGACDSASKNVSCIIQPDEPCAFDAPPFFTCTCDGTNWTCSITGGGFGGGGTCGAEDAGSDAQEDASLDASDADSIDASED